MQHTYYIVFRCLASDLAPDNDTLFVSPDIMLLRMNYRSTATYRCQPDVNPPSVRLKAASRPVPPARCMAYSARCNWNGLDALRWLSPERSVSGPIAGADLTKHHRLTWSWRKPDPFLSHRCRRVASPLLLHLLRVHAEANTSRDSHDSPPAFTCSKRTDARADPAYKGGLQIICSCISYVSCLCLVSCLVGPNSC